MFTHSRCVVCECEVKGSVYGIKPKFCCVDCCTSFVGTKSKHYNRRLVSVSRALYHYNCTHTDLEILNFKTQRNPIEHDGRRMRLFLGAEVEFVREQKFEALNRELMVESVIDYVEEKLAIERKAHRLERILKTKLGELDAVLRAFLLGDYLTKSRGTKTTLLDIQNRMAVIGRVRAILDNLSNAHPGAVFDFCVAYPEAGLAEFMDLQNRCQSVFYSIGERILKELSEQDKTKLEGLALMEEMMCSTMPATASAIFWLLNYSRSGDEEYLMIDSGDLPAESPRRLKLTRVRKTEPPTTY